jgi:hypothetical protein
VADCGLAEPSTGWRRAPAAVPQFTAARLVPGCCQVVPGCARLFEGEGQYAAPYASAARTARYGQRVNRVHLVTESVACPLQVRALGRGTA